MSLDHHDQAAGQPIARVGVVCGADNVRDFVPWSEDTGVSGNNDSLMMLKLLGEGVALSRMQVTPGYFRQKSRRWSFERCQLIWNAISDRDQNPKTLDVAQEVIKAARLPVVNPPSLLGRTSRAALPKHIGPVEGVVAPKVLLLRFPSRERVARQVDEAGFRFPAILRRAGTHNGEIFGMVDGLDGLEPVFGDRTNEYYLIEFVDVRGSDGLYRKSRFFFVGDRIITRQHIIADTWLIHGRAGRGLMSEREDLLNESRAMLIDGFDSLPERTRAALHGIRQAVGLDYAGIDCCIDRDGRVVVFECNATMNFRPTFRNPKTQHNRAALPRMLDAMRRLIEVKTGMSVPGWP